MRGQHILDRLHEALASLRLAVFVMVTLGTTCLVATIYESKHGTAAVQREVYRTGWFTAILALLGLNILFSLLKRYPWKANHTGFVMAHVGILLVLTGSVVSLHYGLDGNMALFEGETTDRVALQDKSLQVAGGTVQPAVFAVDLEKRPPSPMHERRLALPGSDLALVAEDFQPHVEVKEAYRPDPTGGPALHFLLDNPFMKQDGWLSTDDGHREIDLGPAVLALALAGSDADAEAAEAGPAGRNSIRFALAPTGKLFYVLGTRTGERTRGVVESGRPIHTPWMGMTVLVDTVLPHAGISRAVVPAPPPAKDEQRQPAVKVRLEGPGDRSDAEWIPWGETRTLSLGGQRFAVGYRSPEVVAPFNVTLLKFASEKYPGSNMPATYESWVRVDDPEQGVSEHHISMNHPLHYRGYIFFQASFVEGEPMMSIFSVARSPGLPLVYAGTTLIALGVVWMFYVKPALAKRQAQRALAAHRERESRHEAEPSRPSPAGPASPQPAPRGA